MLGSIYGFGPDDVLDMTPAQTAGYLRELRYVCPWSSEFGEPAPLTEQELQVMGQRAGLKIPDGAAEKIAGAKPTQSASTVPKDEQSYVVMGGRIVKAGD